MKDDIEEMVSEIRVYNLIAAKDFLDYHIRNSKTLRNPENYKKHIYGVSRVSHSVAEKVSVIKPEINPNRVRVAGLLHDIGKCLTDDIYNETHIGSNYLIEIGLDEIGNTIKSHFTCAEIIQLQQEKTPEKFNHRFNNYNHEDFLPKTLEQKIITYADVHFGWEEVTPEERIAELLERYGKGDLLEKYPLFHQSIIKGKERLFSLCQEVDSLLEQSNKKL